MELIGYIGAAFIGTSLGLVGAGGGVLTMPLMVYLFKVPALLASSYSLAIVGFTSLLGAAGKYKQGEIRVKTALLFGITSATVVLAIRRFVIPLVPDELFTIAGLPVSSATMSMVLFSVLMIIAACLMVRRKNLAEKKSPSATPSVLNLISNGVAVGLVTGLLGAGGGFILIPALVLILRMPMKEAVGTSLLIIALNSLIGFAVDLSHFEIDWKLLVSIAAIAGAGILAGIAISKRISGQKLKFAFGCFVLVMGIFILGHEVQLFLQNK